MIKVRALAETYMGLNLVTQNLMGGNPFQVELGDLSNQAGTGMYGALTGPQPGVITIKEMLTGSMNTLGSTSTYGTLGKPVTTSGIVTSTTSPLEAIAENFQNNMGNIIVGGVMQTAGWRIFNKVIGKSANKANAMLRKAGLGSTIQI